MKYSKILGAALGVGLASVLAFSAQAGSHGGAKTDISKSLTGKAGDPVNGKKVAVSRKKGNCLACHVISDLSNEPFHGEVGPPLDGIGSNATEGELRARMVDAKAFNPDTIMPSFHMVKTSNVLKKFQGKTIISAQEVEDVVAYLMTLKGSYTAK